MRRLLLILFLALITGRAGYSPEALQEQKDRYVFLAEKHLFLERVYELDFSVDNFRRALIYSEIEHPQIVFSQAVLETGNFTSELFLCGHNLFGMRLARVRETTAIGQWDHHAKYEHWYDSIKDYRLWQEWYSNSGKSLNEYFSFLQDINYATDKNYINKLKSII